MHTTQRNEQTHKGCCHFQGTKWKWNIVLVIRYLLAWMSPVNASVYFSPFLSPLSPSVSLSLAFRLPALTPRVISRKTIFTLMCVCVSVCMCTLPVVCGPFLRGCMKSVSCMCAYTHISLHVRLLMWAHQYTSHVCPCICVLCICSHVRMNISFSWGSEQEPLWETYLLNCSPGKHYFRS